MTRGATKKSFRLPLWGWAALGVLLLGGGVAVALNLPQQGTWRYGACRVFLEDYIRFPTTLRVLGVRENATTATISFSDMNAYGSEQIRDFKCYYSTDARGRTSLSKVTIYDGRKNGPASLPEERIRKYTKMLPAINSAEPDATLPRDAPDDIADFRK